MHGANPLTFEQAVKLDQVIIPACLEDGDNYFVRSVQDGTRFVVQYHGDDRTDIERVWWVAPSGRYTWNQPSHKGGAIYPWAR